MDEQHTDLSEEEEDEDLLELELFTPGQLIVFFALAVPTTTALQALGFGWNATVGCLTISALVAAFGPHLLRYAREHLRERSPGPSNWYRLFLPLSMPVELTVEAEETQTTPRIEIATSSSAPPREAPDEEWQEPITLAMPATAVVPLCPCSPCPPSPSPVRQHDPEASLPEQLAIHQLWQVCAPSAGALPRPGTEPARSAEGPLAPQTRKDVLTLFSRNARDGRRRGIGVCLIAHRIAGINKDVLLCEWMILHRPQATDLKRYMELVPTVPKERFQRLRQGQAVVVSPSGIRDILFHKARSHDNGATPGLAQLRLHEEQRTLASIGADQRASCSTHEPAR